MWLLLEEGGWGAYPPLLFGLLSVVVAIAHALTLRRDLVPILVAFGAVTVLSGGLGFIAGLRVVLLGVGDHFDQQALLLGIKECTSPLALGLGLPSLAAFVSVVGALRLAIRGAQAVEEP
jgi:hypothetical protein